MLAESLPQDAEAGVDGTDVTVTSHGRTTRLAPVWAGAGFPRDVRNALRTADPTAGAVIVVVARRLSPGARRDLQAAGVAWVQTDGSARLSTPSGLVVARDLPPTPQARPAQAGWTTATADVAELLLTRPPGEPVPPVRAAAAMVGLSPAATSRALTTLDHEGWTTKEGPRRGAGARRLVADAGALLDAWSAWSSGRPRRRVATHALVGDVDTWLDRLTTVWPTQSWALTGWAAAARRAAFADPVGPVEIYLTAQDTQGQDRTSLLRAAGLRTVDDEAARVVLVAPERLTLRTSHLDHGVPIVSDVRLYADLLTSGVRGEDAAEHLRTTRIGF
ncbi:hypothetical protein GCM10023113_06440 [Cellulomonas oligotrophica]|uniref:HTH marR-type domain-containing protein n=1 Tax=Cellulomonas oligotrophica TaxID=931536 RepID=A0ABQ4DAS9_9CELL|nr:hypothetical protein Col01nite_15610 [Cellulomonas oligotrophica]